MKPGDCRTVQQHAGWYAGACQDQGRALIECMQQKIEQQTKLLTAIAAEIELCYAPRERSPEMVLASIRQLIEDGQTPVVVQHGFFEWTA